MRLLFWSYAISVLLLGEYCVSRWTCQTRQNLLMIMWLIHCLSAILNNHVLLSANGSFAHARQACFVCKQVARMADTLDRGYAWVVMGACFVLQMLISFSFASFGFFLVEYVEYFNESKTVTSWIGAVLFATAGMMGKLIHWGPRQNGTHFADDNSKVFI